MEVAQVIEYQCHPACLCLPKMSDEEYGALRESIAAGFDSRHPILLCDGMILDGRHRYNACRDEMVEPQFIDFTGGDPFDFVRREHEARRSWVSQEQKVLVGKKLLRQSEAWQADRQREREEANRARSEAAKAQPRNKDGTMAEKPVVGHIDQQPDAPTSRDKTRQAEAEALGVNTSAVKRADYIEKHAPDLAEKVEQGELAAAKAISEIKLAKRKEAVIEQTRTAAEATPPTVERADAVQWLAAQEPADLLLTDPPYMTDVPDIRAFADSWLPLALSKVKPTGRAFVCIGAYPEELHAYTSVAMPTQILVWTYRNTLGPSPKKGYKLNWQAILYYEMPDAPNIDCPVMLEQFTVQDINAPDGRLGDRFHAWQKPMQLAERFIRHSTKPGQTVIDPFCCTGTFILAAAKLGRIGRGCDIDAQSLKIATERGCKHV